MKLYRATEGVFVENDGQWCRADVSIDALFRSTDPAGWLGDRLDACEVADATPDRWLAPIESQEVWAAGVTYYRSREARMEESQEEADVYDRVYTAHRPELFFKATPHRVVGHGGSVAIRRDSDWNVPEAELALAINREGHIFGYTVGNDVSSRSIEGDNPLYLPQAKIYDGSCALGPALVVTRDPLPSSTAIRLRVTRNGTVMTEGETRLSGMKREPRELVEWLFFDNSFPDGCYLLTGTGIVPDAAFTLESGDVVSIEIDGVGVLENRVRRR